MYKLFLVLCCWYSLSIATAQSFQLKDRKGMPVVFSEKVTGKARVYYFLSPECPLCQSYSLTIRQLYAEFSKQGIEMVGIIPGTDFTITTIAEYNKQYNIPMPLYIDEQLKLVQKYKVTITPEVVVLDKAGKVVYQGRIDNWAYELGKKRKVITEHNLKDALTSIVQHKPIVVSKTKAVGCFIE